jgi:ADP-ribosylglycohydrolase
VDASSCLTHTDPRTAAAALAAAEAAAAIITCPDPRTETRRRLPGCSPLPAWQNLCRQIDAALDGRRTTHEFARALDLERGVTGYALHSVPVALYAWLRHPGDFRGALTSALDCGGDTDTVGAIVGALAGCEAGPDALPAEWLGGIREWPRGLRTLQGLARRLAETLPSGRPGPPVRYLRAGVPVRNLFLLGIVLAHGLRRLLPPW